MTTPRPIEPSEIRVGDKVRACREDCIAEGPVGGVGDMYVSLGASEAVLNCRIGTWSFTLLHRPEPPREPGSRWREDKAGGGEYILDEDGDYVWYRGKRAGAYCLSLQDDADIIARLVPLDGTR